MPLRAAPRNRHAVLACHVIATSVWDIGLSTTVTVTVRATLEQQAPFCHVELLSAQEALSV